MTYNKITYAFKLLAVISITLIFRQGSAQSPYTKLLDTAEDLFTAKKYTAAARAYHEAYEFLYMTRPLYQESIAWVKAGKKKRAIKRMSQAIQSGSVQLEALQNDSSFVMLYDCRQWQNLIKQMQLAQNNLNKDLQRRLTEMRQTDQKYRKQIMKLYNSKSPDPQEIKFLKKTL